MFSEIYWPIFQNLLTVFHITYWFENWTPQTWPSGLFKIKKHFQKKELKYLIQILSEVPQRSILGPIVFHIDICNLFLIIKDRDIANFADENASYLSGKKCWRSFERLRECVLKLFSVIYWKGIEKKCKQFPFTDKLYWKCA